VVFKVAALRNETFKAQWLLYVPPALALTNSTFCPHSVFMCFVWISEQTAIISLYSINLLVFIAQIECVYCAVRTESLNIRSGHTVYLCVLCGSQNKQRLFPYTALTDWFL
jgi:DNA-directed RNA polymerase subunit RPC12/RpoP